MKLKDFMNRAAGVITEAYNQGAIHAVTKRENGFDLEAYEESEKLIEFLQRLKRVRIKNRDTLVTQKDFNPSCGYRSMVNCSVPTTSGWATLNIWYRA